MGNFYLLCLHLFSLILLTNTNFVHGSWVYRGTGNCLDQQWGMYDFIEYDGVPQEDCAAATYCLRPQVIGYEIDTSDVEVPSCKCLFDRPETAETVPYSMLYSASNYTFDLDGNSTIWYANRKVSFPFPLERGLLDFSDSILSFYRKM